MEIIRIKDHFDPKFKEYIIGPAQTKSRGVYLVYGEVRPGERRSLGPGAGHEEVLCILSGRGALLRGETEKTVEAGDVLYLDSEFSAELVVRGAEEVRYVSAGGHVPGGGHGH